MRSLRNNILQVVDDIFGQRTHQTKVASLSPVITERDYFWIRSSDVLYFLLMLHRSLLFRSVVVVVDALNQ